MREGLEWAAPKVITVVMLTVGSYEQTSRSREVSQNPYLSTRHAYIDAISGQAGDQRLFEGFVSIPGSPIEKYPMIGHTTLL